MNNLSIKSEYHVPEKVTVGNGQSLNISYFGKVSLPTLNSDSIQLHNVLVILQITKNLLSISKPIGDNNLCVVFQDKCCFIKDLIWRKLL
ncbi:hypothetical protein Patl1_11482 [Pistacia atlantica]|uniref:Uncharacterized protein n=1 Tax=Pistacia atlantica TaxID=434234 RepID=A0ACC1A417_9ROSI|nr:hypothetical protein Patl1_11482 [Pistacia atlantica]